MTSHSPQNRDKNKSLPLHILATIRHRKKPKALAAAAPQADMRVASYNVHKCVGADRRFDPGRTAEVIREIGADVIALQEADTRFGERTGLLDLKWLEREAGLMRVPLEGSLAAHGFHGNTLLFREGLVRDIHLLKLPGLEPRGALITELELKNGVLLRIIAAHLGLLRRSRNQQARRILDIMHERGDCPTLLVGDLNEWRLGNGSSLSTLAPVFDPSAAVPSFPAGLPVLALDRIMANRPDLVSHVEAHETPLSRIASDHLPVKAAVHLPAA